MHVVFGIHTIPEGAVTRTTLSITSLQEHGVRWHLAAIAECVCFTPIRRVVTNTINRFAISRIGLCTTFSTRMTTSPCCYLCIAPLAVTMLFPTSRPLGRSRYDSPECIHFFIVGVMSWRIIFMYCTLYYFLSQPPQSLALSALVQTYLSSRIA
jgi:hypothetical protein